jgi:phosphoglucomutase
LRVYLERYSRDRLAEDSQAFLAPLIEAADALAGIRAATGRDGPSVIT